MYMGLKPAKIIQALAIQAAAEMISIVRFLPTFFEPHRFLDMSIMGMRKFMCWMLTFGDVARNDVIVSVSAHIML